MEKIGELFVHCREVVHSSECPLSEVPLYTCTQILYFSPDNTVVVCCQAILSW